MIGCVVVDLAHTAMQCRLSTSVAWFVCACASVHSPAFRKMHLSRCALNILANAMSKFKLVVNLHHDDDAACHIVRHFQH